MIKKKYILTLIFIFSIVSPVYSELPNAVVKIFCFSQQPDPDMPWRSFEANSSSGTGFVVEGNHLLTNAHVVSYAKYIAVKKQNDSRRYNASIHFISHEADLALLKISEKHFFEAIDPLKLGGLPKLDDKVKTIGFPIGGETVSVTNGVVSRIGKIIYSHTNADEHLGIQTDAAINPGNSGGPVLLDGVVAGMAFQGIRSGDNIGYMIPTTLIKHFIKDSLDGKIDKIPEMGVFYSELPPVMKQYLKASDDIHGILILGTHPLSPAHSVIQKNDILMKIDELDISDDGHIILDGLMVPFYEMIERKQYGEQVTLTWYRDQTIKTEKVTLKPFIRPFPIGATYNPEPNYYIYGGLVFIELTGDYLRNFGQKWWTDIPWYFRLLYFYQTYVNKNMEREKYIILSQVLIDKNNVQARSFKRKILSKVNSITINSLHQLKQIIDESKDQYLKLNFEHTSKDLILDKDKLDQVSEKIIQTHQIRKPHHLESHS